MEHMNITSAQYIALEGVNDSIRIIIDGQELSVPLNPKNRHYKEIMRQVAAGDLTIADAE